MNLDTEKIHKMNKKIAGPISTGNAGAYFENQVQAMYVVLMLTGGDVPGMEGCTIEQIKLQNRIEGEFTDDFSVQAVDRDGNRRKLLIQVKLNVNIQKSDQAFKDTLRNAWLDFQNGKVSIHKHDRIVLITSRLAREDKGFVSVLEQIHSLMPKERFQEFQEKSYSEEKQKIWRSLLEIIKKLEPSASEEELFEFMKLFYILTCDLDVYESIIRTLLLSSLKQQNLDYRYIWDSICSWVAQQNKNAGVITRGIVPAHISLLFPAHPQKYLELFTRNWNPDEKRFLSLLNLIGCWDGNNPHDMTFIEKITETSYSQWIVKVTQFLKEKKLAIKKTGSIYQLQNRIEIWDDMGEWIQDFDLKRFADEFLKIWNVDSFCSPHLRQGTAMTLALLGARADQLVNCSRNNKEKQVTEVIWKLFSRDNWLANENLSAVLPLLAEAAPGIFLEQAQNIRDCEKEWILKNSNSSLRNCLHSLPYTLKLLAWDEKYLTSACNVLGLYAEHLPEGNLRKRYLESLTLILHPKRPQTIGDANKQLGAIKGIVNEFPQVGWQLTVSLMPGQTHMLLMETYTSVRMKIPECVPVSSEQYHEKILKYMELLIQQINNNPDRIERFIEILPNMPDDFIQKCELLEQCSLNSFSDEEKRKIWECLLTVIERHKRFPEAAWSMNSTALIKLKDIAQKFKPTSLIKQSQRLFARNNWNLKEEHPQHQIFAVQKIWCEYGIEGVMELGSAVDGTWEVGAALAKIDGIENAILPKLLHENEKISDLISAYMLQKISTMGWEWYDSLDRSSWTEEELCLALIPLPFSRDAWERVEQLSPEAQKNYWNASHSSSTTSEEEAIHVIKNYLKFQNPQAAIPHLYSLIRHKNHVPVDLCIQALADAKTEYPSPYEISGLIQFLQIQPNIDIEKLESLEWKYLSLLTNTIPPQRPLYLERKFASDPAFFCKLIRSCYRPQSQELPLDDVISREELSNAWKLLDICRIVPGNENEEYFDSSKFQSWVQQVKEISTKTGHYSSAMRCVGALLFYSPKDKDFWINRTIAKELNRTENVDMREAFGITAFNSFGFHHITENSEAECCMAAKYNTIANVTEEEGFLNLAKILRDVSKRFQCSAEENTEWLQLRR